MAVLVAAYGLPVMSKAAWNRFTSGTRDEVSVVFSQHLLSQRFVFIGSVPDDYRGHFLQGLLHHSKGLWHLDRSRKDMENRLKAENVAAKAAAKAKAKPKARPKAKGRPAPPKVIDLGIRNADVHGGLWFWGLFRKLHRFDRPEGVFMSN